jgi:uncharacterized membrane protein
MASISEKTRPFGRRLVSYFFQGLLLIAPASFTVFVIIKIFDLFDSNTNPLFERIFHFTFPGLGILVFAVFITVFGFIGSTVLIKPLLNVIENLLEHTPLVKDIYSSFKDFISAFISNKRKFNKPVIVEIGKGSGIFRPGFITDDDLGKFNIADKVGVYFPQSYTFAGHLYFVNKDQISEIPSSMSAEMIKYILSGGVMEMSDDNAFVKTDKS